MTREEFSQKFRWSKVVWLGGFVNVAGMMLQPLAIVQTHKVSGISIGMFVMFISMQVIFGVEAFIKRSYGVFYSMMASALLSATTICLVLYYR